MIWCRFDDFGRARYGLVEGDTVVPVTGDPFTGHEPHPAEAHPVDGLRWLPPVMPSTFFCAGLNYKGHAERAAYGGHEVPTRPEIGYRANNALTGHLEPIVRPADCHEPLVAEGELVAVIGATVPRRCTRAEAERAVLGWTIGNDVSARGWQRTDRSFWRCKNSDTFKPMGPYLVTGADPLAATTTVRLDGEVRASFPTGDMLFDPYDFIGAMSRYITLRPGDVVWMGTDETATMVPGQVVQISIDGLGTLTNPVTEEALLAMENNQAMSGRPAYIHHVNFPTTDPERTIEWYTKVFGMKYIKPKSNTKVVLMTRGNFDLHFTPVEEMDRMAPYHFAVEVEDWHGFLAHLRELGIRHTRPITRPENNSMFCYIHDPDHTMIELVYHHRRQFPPPMEYDPAQQRPTEAPAAESAEEARGVLSR